MADSDNATVTPPVGEIPPFPTEPAGPKDGEAPAEVDSDFILSTLFGENATPSKDKKPAGDSGQGAQPAGGADTGTAPPTPAPAAKGQEPAPPAQPAQAAPVSQPGTEQPPVGGQPASQPAPGTPPAAPTPQTPPQPELTAEQRLQLANANALAAQNAQLLARLEALERGGQPAQPQGQPTAQPQQPGVPREQVLLAVPDNLYDAVFDEDPGRSKQGLNILASAIASEAANFVLQRVGPMINNSLQGYDRVQSAKSNSQRQEEDYYGAFPAHSNPLYRPLIEAEMQAMTSAMPHAAWTEDFRNALGARVNSRLQLLGFPVGQPSQQQGQGGQAPTGHGNQGNGGLPPVPAPMLDPTSRGAAPKQEGEFIAATFA